jgi:hypothetical protein
MKTEINREMTTGNPCVLFGVMLEITKSAKSSGDCGFGWTAIVRFDGEIAFEIWAFTIGLAAVEDLDFGFGVAGTGIIGRKSGHSEINVYAPAR